MAKANLSLICDRGERVGGDGRGRGRETSRRLSLPSNSRGARDAAAAPSASETSKSYVVAPAWPRTPARSGWQRACHLTSTEYLSSMASAQAVSAIYGDDGHLTKSRQATVRRSPTPTRFPTACLELHARTAGHLDPAVRLEFAAGPIGRSEAKLRAKEVELEPDASVACCCCWRCCCPVVRPTGESCCVDWHRCRRGRCHRTVRLRRSGSRRCRGRQGRPGSEQRRDGGVRRSKARRCRGVEGGRRTRRKGECQGEDRLIFRHNCSQESRGRVKVSMDETLYHSSQLEAALARLRAPIAGEQKGGSSIKKADAPRTASRAVTSLNVLAVS